MAKLAKGDRCRLKGNNYMALEVYKILPRGSHGRNCILVECKASGGTYPPKFDFAPIKIFRMIDLIKEVLQ